MAQAPDIKEYKPIAYSYVRFSSAKQELGDSLRRQVAMAEAFCKKHHLELHPVTYRDLGVSAFKRKNLNQGALAAFINAVKSGKIEKGSYLVIEQFDRLSRADVDVALKLLLDLVHSGIKLVTLSDEKIWDSETIKELHNLVVAILLMSRANNESAAKAERISSAWSEKKRNASVSGKIMTRECPQWLQVNEDKSAFVPIEDRVESVRKVFEMRIGGHGTVSIVNRANKEKWPVPGKGKTWHTSLVGRLLHNRAVLGEYQPHKIANDDNKRVPVGDAITHYYPPILDEQTFLRAQAVSQRKGEFPGRRDVSYRNWLQGLLKCSCGHSFVRKNKQSAKQPGYARYYCTARHRGLTNCPSLGAKEIEGAVIYAVSMIAPQFWNGTARLAELIALSDIQQVDLTLAQERRNRFAEAIGSTNESIPTLVERLEIAQREVEAAEKTLSLTRNEISELQGNSDDVFEKIAKTIEKVESIDARAELRENLSRILIKCVVNVEAGFIAVYFRGESLPTNILLRPDGVIPGITSGQMTKEEFKKVCGFSLDQSE